jgi:hypothetical protein
MLKLMADGRPITLSSNALLPKSHPNSTRYQKIWKMQCYLHHFIHTKRQFPMSDTQCKRSFIFQFSIYYNEHKKIFSERWNFYFALNKIVSALQHAQFWTINAYNFFIEVEISITPGTLLRHQPPTYSEGYKNVKQLCYKLIIVSE